MCCVVSSFLSKVFQCLLIGGENVGPDAKRNAETFVISDEQFDGFVQRHKSVPQLVPESNTAMKDSYLILDEYVSYNHALSYSVYRNVLCCGYLSKLVQALKMPLIKHPTCYS